MLIPSALGHWLSKFSSLSRRVNANSQRACLNRFPFHKLIKKGEC